MKPFSAQYACSDAVPPSAAPRVRERSRPARSGQQQASRMNRLTDTSASQCQRQGREECPVQPAGLARVGRTIPLILRLVAVLCRPCLPLGWQATEGDCTQPQAAGASVSDQVWAGACSRIAATGGQPAQQCKRTVAVAALDPQGTVPAHTKQTVNSSSMAAPAAALRPASLLCPAAAHCISRE